MNVLLPDGEAHIGDDSQLVVEEVVADDVANEGIIDEISDNYANRRKGYAAVALRTNDYLKGRPRVYVPPGRTPYANAKIESGEGVDEDPPTLSDPDGGYATPSMRPHFRMYADATLRKADHIFRSGATTSHSVPLEEGVTGVDTALVLEEAGTGEQLEHILDESLGMEQQEVVEQKQEIFYDAEDERTEDYDITCPLFADQPIDFPEACEIILGNTRVPDDKVCKTTPHSYRGVGTFIVDWSGIDRLQIGIDGFGSWGKPSGRTRFYQMNLETNKYVCVSDSRGQIAKGTPYDAKCQLRKYEHPTTTATNNGADRFIKKIISCVSTDNQTVFNLAIICYEWIGRPFDFTYSIQPRRSARNPAPAPPEGTKNWEEASFQSSAFGSFPPTCIVKMGECPLYSMGAIQFTDVCQIIMGATIVEEDKICNSIPQRFREGGTFVVNATALGSELELRRDDNGQWGKPACNSRYYKYDGNDATRLDRSGKLDPAVKADSAYDVQVLCKRYEHPLTGNRFVRKIYTGRMPYNKNYHQAYDLAVITYFWKGEPIPFDIVPQRKVRLHNSSEYEMIKRNGGLNVFEEEEIDESMMGMEAGGANVFMDHERDFVDDEPSERMLDSPPTRKRRKSNGPSMAAQRHDMQEETAGTSEHEMHLAKVALENQERFSMLLDRFESVAEKMERMTEMQLNMMYRARQYTGEHESRHRHEEGVQYVEEEEVYDME